MQNMKKITMVVGMALTLTAGLAGTAGPAWATGYLAPPTLGSGTDSFTVQGSSNTTIDYTINSSYGNTFPTIAAIRGAGVSGPITGITNSIGGSSITFNPSTLDLKMVASMTSNYSATAGNLPGDFINGQIMSDVFKVGSGSTMSGAKPGELVFTYQFDVTSTSPKAIGINAANLSFFNNPGGQFYILGDGINSTSLGTPLCAKCSVTNLASANLSGSITYDPLGGTVQAVSESTGGQSIFAGSVSPQFFVASNALYYSIGSMGLQGDGMNGTGGIFVPNTPEPGTLVLFGTGLVLLGFMTLRKKARQVAV